MSVTNWDVVARWAAGINDPDAQPYYPRRGNVHVYPGDPDGIYSYGSHFEMARIMRDAHKVPTFVLVNGDTYSVSTSRHQSEVRAAVQRSGLPALIVPHSALRSAGIDHRSIVPVGIERDTVTTTTHEVASLDEIAQWRRGDARQLDSGRWAYDTERHWLGEATFRATVEAWSSGEHEHRRDVYFLSAFDHQEAQHYFLCELPAPVSSVAEAFASLRPASVVAAQHNGLDVTRQGDVFAIPLPAMTTRAVRKLGEASRMAEVVSSHVATEVISDGVTTYARGNLWHRPTGWGRRPEHRRQRMGDGKAWHLIVKNTVPTDRHGASRAWSASGNVD